MGINCCYSSLCSIISFKKFIISKRRKGDKWMLLTGKHEDNVYAGILDTSTETRRMYNLYTSGHNSSLFLCFVYKWEIFFFSLKNFYPSHTGISYHVRWKTSERLLQTRQSGHPITFKTFERCYGYYNPFSIKYCICKDILSVHIDIQLLASCTV